MEYVYKTKNTCATHIKFDIEGNRIYNVQFTAGCNGNLQAIAKLVEGLTVEEIEEKCSGIACGPRSTSCSDQLTIAVREALSQAEACSV